MRRTVIATSGVLALGAGLMVPVGIAGAADSSTAGGALADHVRPQSHAVSLSGPKKPVVAGQRFTVKGKVVGATPTKATVKLQRKKAKKKWVTVTKTKTNKNGKYRSKVKFGSTRRVKLRAVVANSARYCASDNARRCGTKRLRSDTLTIRFTQPAQPPTPTNPAPVVTVPEAPTEVTAVAGDGQVALSWTAPASDGGATITAYQVQAIYGGAVASVHTVAASATTASVTGLTNGNVYTFTVLAVNSAGTSPMSTVSNPAAPFVPGVCSINGQVVDTVANGLDEGPIQDAVQEAGDQRLFITIQGTCHDYNIDITNTQDILLQALPTGGDNHTIDAQQKGQVIINEGDLTTYGDLTITGGTTFNNTSTRGGGIYNSGGTVILRGNTAISGNTANVGGGITNRGTNATLTLDDNATISDNTGNDAGGIYNMGGTVNFNGGTITSNTTYAEGGGIYNSFGGTVILDGGTITGNTANWDGGGIYNSSCGTVILNGGTITSNTAKLEEGGGIYNSSCGTVILNGGTITNNTTSTYGGGIYNRGTVTLNGGTITRNTANRDGGGIYNYRGTVNGDRLLVMGNDPNEIVSVS